jgi:O-Antigen ligase
VYVFAKSPRTRRVLVVVAVLGAAAVPFALRGHERTAYWHVAAREAEVNPVAGSGAGTFADWWLRERSTPLSTKEAHSLYLETLAELGPVGLALLLTVFAVAIAAASRGGQPVLAAAVTAYAVGTAVDFHWELAGVTVPAVILAAAGVSAPRRRRSSVRALPVLVPLLAATVLAYAGNARLASARAALSTGDDARAAADARSALRFAPFSADAWGVLGDATHNPSAYRHGIALDRNEWTLWFRLAAVTSGEPHRLALREAARLNPLGPSEP